MQRVRRLLGNLHKPKKYGRLGIKNIKMFSIVLLARWKWSLRIDKQGLWKEIGIKLWDMEEVK